MINLDNYILFIILYIIFYIFKLDKKNLLK